MAVRDHRLVRGTVIVLPDLVVAGSLAVKLRSVLVVDSRGYVMLRCMVFAGHDGSELIASQQVA